MIRFELDQQKAVRFTLSVEGDVNKYALSFLNIFNHCREYSYAFYKIENNYDNNVYVTCNPCFKEEVCEYLAEFGEIIAIEDIMWNVIEVNYDSAGYDKLYPERMDVDFAVSFD